MRGRTRDPVHKLEVCQPSRELNWVKLTFASAWLGVYIKLNYYLPVNTSGCVVRDWYTVIQDGESVCR
jgi:hypothetical protein